MDALMVSYAFPDDGEATLEKLLTELPNSVACRMTEVPAAPRWMLTLPIVEAVQVQLAHPTSDLPSDGQGTLLVGDLDRDLCIAIMAEQGVKAGQWKRVVVIEFHAEEARAGFDQGARLICSPPDQPVSVCMSDFH